MRAESEANREPAKPFTASAIGARGPTTNLERAKRVEGKEERF
ncbi:hypothetical protein [Halovivax sp.]|nr:hypothetical protein [Halovivax sp.]